MLTPIERTEQLAISVKIHAEKWQSTRIDTFEMNLTTQMRIDTMNLRLKSVDELIILFPVQIDQGALNYISYLPSQP